MNIRRGHFEQKNKEKHIKEDKSLSGGRGHLPPVEKKHPLCRRRGQHPWQFAWQATWDK